MEIGYLKVQFSGSSDEIADALDFIQAAPFGQLTLTISYRGGREDQITIETSEDSANPATVRSLLQKVTKLSSGTRNTAVPDMIWCTDKSCCTYSNWHFPVRR